MLFGSLYSNAQSAIGLRFGGGAGVGTEVSWQTPFGGNRLEIDGGINSGDKYSRIALSGVYQWVMPIQNSFKWYVGAGASLGIESHDTDYDGKGHDGFGLGATGQIGIEYTFNIPLQLSLDIRPNFWLVQNTYFDINTIALGIRYVY
ncbi:hypothetical protein GCM10011318_11570 [Phaeocystidibacter marisrubri]|nr:hypothetical protein GCM10011318_11570 [Phaeocystidibacter marisrubri]